MSVTEIAPDVYRISTFIPEADLAVVMREVLG
jgi:hypothetical protein